MEETEVKEDIWMGEELLVIKNIHARVCERCGERILSYDEMHRIEGVIREFERGKMELKELQRMYRLYEYPSDRTKRSSSACWKSKKALEHEIDTIKAKLGWV